MGTSGRQNACVGAAVGASVKVGAAVGTGTGTAVGALPHLKPTRLTPNHKSSGSVVLPSESRRWRVETSSTLKHLRRAPVPAARPRPRRSRPEPDTIC